MRYFPRMSLGRVLASGLVVGGAACATASTDDGAGGSATGTGGKGSELTTTTTGVGGEGGSPSTTSSAGGSGGQSASSSGSGGQSASSSGSGGQSASSSSSSGQSASSSSSGSTGTGGDPCGGTACTSLLSAGYFHTCAVVGGGLKCWGRNFYGELGDGSTSERDVPVNVSGLSTGVLSVSAGRSHTCAITSLGAVKCWGDNLYGELGNNSTSESHAPVDVMGLSTGVLSVSAGRYATCAVTSVGAVKCWGNNLYGQLGNNSTSTSHVPVDVTGLSTGVLSVSVADSHVCAVTSAGAVKCWGKNLYGQLGNNATTESHVPVSVLGLSTGGVAVSASDEHTCAVTSAGAVKCWGKNLYGELGNDSTSESHVPVDVLGLSTGGVAVDAGADHTCAITSVGAIKCWGSGYDGRLGNNSTTESHVPVDVTGLSAGGVFVSAGTYHTCAGIAGGALKCWGDNLYGELGDNSTTDSHVPVDVMGL